ncbi:non-ribosomal peptide synthetase [Candidatus Enterococcus murrayae]|uniref:Amino acid adenylation domain-containing protein n=1 Tax=Candidatus Enterococcus murrayae TaxID=2815321 RepID=A0ABS3HN74_9ENTE|nr:non-ribosomal peptide synthetase [Enterococcus sp. MJM16]MBO0454912.1 amino acid adenylation domain-containing protein [Enterococcus sp. MJM16]
MKKYEMSSQQKRMFSLQIAMNGIGSQYNIPSLYKLDGNIDIDILEKSIQTLIKRHEVLRTSFHYEKGVFVQAVHDTKKFKIGYFNWNEDAISKRELFQNLVKPFNLSKPGPFRVRLIETLKTDQSYLFFDFHHIIFDGISGSIFFQELDHLMRGISLEKFETQYKDYAYYLNNKDYTEEREFWTNTYKEGFLSNNFRADLLVTPNVQNLGASFIKSLDKKLQNETKRFSRKLGTTEFIVLLACYAMTIKTISLENEMIVGVPVSGRTVPNIQGLIGLFVNTIPVKIKIDYNLTFQEIVKNLTSDWSEYLKNQDYPLDMLLEDLHLKRDNSKLGIVETLFSFNSDSESDIDLAGVKLINQAPSTETTKFELSLDVINSENGYQMYWEYSTELFKQDTIRKLSTYFENFLESVLSNEHTPIGKIGLNISEDKETRLVKNQEFIENTLLDKFEETVICNPNKTAVKFENHSLSFKELNERCNYLGKVLQQAGVKKNQTVGIMMDRSIDMIIAIYGILKAGAAYLPLDPSHPKDRISFILEDSHTSIVLSDHKRDKLNIDFVNTLLINDYQSMSSVTPEREIFPDDLAYVIYTSGTTGTPKGVMIEHKGVINLAKWLYRYGKYSSETVVLQNFNYIFDGSVPEIFSCGLFGNTLEILSEAESKDPQQLLNRWSGKQITLVPSMFRAVLEYAKATNQIEEFNRFERIYVAGEALDKDLLDTYSKIPGSKMDKFHNNYGPTEGTVCATSGSFENWNGDVVTIGKPIENVRVDIFQNETACDVGIVGELCISGVGVARGYLNRPDLTEKSFVKNPLTGERMYRTGDLACWLEDGQIQYMGRIDDQVKLRGYRIEIEEIENQLRRQMKIRDAQVKVIEEEASSYLCGYVLATEDFNEEESISTLSDTLPKYMIPSRVLCLPEFPRSNSGKIDKKALPIPEKKTKRDYVSPRNGIENVIVQAFEEILGVTMPSIEDDFFELGGDSIKAIRLVSKIREAGLSITVQEIMKERTISLISESARKIEESSTYEHVMEGEFPLSKMQKKFFDSELPEPNQFSMSLVLEANHHLDGSVVKESMKILIEYHDQLRASFLGKIGNIRPKCESDLCFELIEKRKPKGLPETAWVSQMCQKMQHKLSIKNEELIKLGLFHTEEHSYIFFLFHHLIVDGVSLRIIMDDFKTIYRQKLQNEQLKLPAKSVSFKQWIESVNLCEVNISDKEKAYWKKVNEKIEVEFYHEEEQEQENLSFNFELSKDYTEKLLKKANFAYHTEINDILLSALGIAFSKIFKKKEFSVMLESHGRQNDDVSLRNDRTVGWFTTVYPVILKKENSLKKMIRETKETLHSIPNYGMNYTVKNLTTPLLTFNYHGNLQESTEEKGTSLLTLRNDIDTGEAVSLSNNFGTAVSFNSVIVDGNFKVIVDQFDSGKYPIEKLGNEFISSLVNIIDHCCEVQRSEKTASDYGNQTLTDGEYMQIDREISKMKNEIEAIYPVTPTQKGMIYLALKDTESSAHILQSIFLLNDQIDLDRFQVAIEKLVAKYSVLRTNFYHQVVGEIVQVVVRDKKIRTDRYINEIDVSQLAKDILKNKISFENQELVNFSLIENNIGEKYFIITIHHLLIDGWSFGLLVNDLMDFYEEKNISFVEDNKVKSKYLLAISQKKVNESENYWKDLLDGCTDDLLTITPDKLTIEKNTQISEREIILENKLTTDLKELCRKLGITFNTIIEFVWGTILQKYNNTNDTFFGKVVSGRNFPIDGLEKQVGMFINTVPVRVRNNGSKSIERQLIDLHQQTINSQEHEYFPLYEIKNSKGLISERIGTIITFENFDTIFDTSSIFKEEVASREETPYSLSLKCYLDDQLRMTVIYDENKYSGQLVSSILKVLIEILTQMTDQELLKNNATFNLNHYYENQLLNLSDKKIEYKNVNVVTKFEEIVRQKSEQIAVSFDTRELSYKKLNEMANSLAKKMQDRGNYEGEIIGIRMDRSLEMIISMLAVLKVNAAFLPLSPIQPIDRINFILNDCNVKLVLTDNPDRCLDVLQLNVALDDLSAEENLYLTNYSDKLAYVIYTSGTTGNPKGVKIKHSGISNLTEWLSSFAEYSDTTEVIQNFNYVFDGSIFEIFPILLSGGKLLMISEEDSKDLKKLLSLIAGRQITMVPTMFRELLEYAKSLGRIDVFDRFDRIHLAGEKLTTDLIEDYLNYGGQQIDRISNCYGPTEGTVCITAKHLDLKSSKKITIGKQIDNMEILIVGMDNSICGPGMIGEICVSGIGVADGYINRPEITSEKFVQHPINKKIKMYRTGDIGLWNIDGEIEFIGRIDDQVKLRGYRIELTEIEISLRRIDSIKDAVVKIDKSKDSLCAFVVLNESQFSIDEKTIMEELSLTLPRYMIPERIVVVKHFPTSSSGKLDLKQLEIPERINQVHDYHKPKGKKEILVADAFQKILNVEEKISRDTDFFEIGGHSLAAIKLKSEIEKQGYLSVSISDIMNQRNVMGIAKHCSDKTKPSENDLVLSLDVSEDLI